MKYNISLKNQVTQLIGIILLGPIFGGLTYYFYKSDGGFSTALSVFVIYIAVTFLITILIHCEYYSLNKGRTIILDTDKKTISFSEDELIPFQKIQKITVSMTQLWYYKGNVWVLPSDLYHYATIEYEGNKKFVFTSLMAYDVEKIMKEIEGVIIERNLRPIPSPMLSRLLRLK